MSSKSENILFLAPELLSIGGIQRQNRLVIAALDELLNIQNGRLRVLALNDYPSAPVPVELLDLRATSLTCFGGNRFAYMRQYLCELAKANMVIYGLLGLTLMGCTHAAVRSRCSRLLFLYGIEAWYRRSFWHAMAVRSMDGYVSISRYTLNRFCSAYGIHSSRSSFVLPNVVSPRLMDHFGESSSSAVGCGLLTVSRLAEGYKGIDLVLRSLPSLIQRFPNLRYVLVGDGRDRPRLEQLSRDLGVERFVDFLGFVSEETLKSAYRNCTVFVLPSSEEGFGFVFIEAMAYGKPVIAVNAGASPEVIADGRTGLLVEPDNVVQLTAAIASLLNNPAVRQQMGQAGIETVKTHFSYASLKVNLSNLLAAYGFSIQA